MTKIGWNVRIDNSSNIKYIGYDTENLTITFLNGGRYEYKNVPAELVNNLLKAESKGKFFSSQIKDKFTCEKLKPAESIISTEEKNNDPTALNPGSETGKDQGNNQKATDQPG